MYSMSDSMKTQVYGATDHLPNELVFGQKPPAILFPGGDGITATKEEDSELD